MPEEENSPQPGRCRLVPQEGTRHNGATSFRHSQPAATKRTSSSEQDGTARCTQTSLLVLPGPPGLQPQQNQVARRNLLEALSVRAAACVRLLQEMTGRPQSLWLGFRCKTSCDPGVRLASVAPTPKSPVARTTETRFQNVRMR